jgi:hypothetical protein
MLPQRLTRTASTAALAAAVIDGHYEEEQLKARYTLVTAM